MDRPSQSRIVEGIWSEQNTAPAAIDEGLRGLLHQRHAEGEAYAPARALNLIAVVDREWRGEVENRLERIDRRYPSRTVICAIDPGRTSMDALVTMEDADATGDGFVICRERIRIAVGPGHVPYLDTVVGPLLIRDLPTLVWSPHGHPEAVDALVKVAEVVLVDPFASPDIRAALDRAGELATRAYVVDLAWLRGKPWRERIAAVFDPPRWRAELAQLTCVTVGHAVDSTGSGLLFMGWLASRLGWEVAPLTPVNGAVEGWARGHRQRVRVRLEAAVELGVPGLAGVTLESASGMTMSLKRAPGGLAVVRRSADGHADAWTVLGASRGEGGVLAEGIQQALLRDPTYRPALKAAQAMAV